MNERAEEQEFDCNKHFGELGMLVEDDMVGEMPPPRGVEKGGGVWRRMC